MSNSHLLAIDIGTQSARAVIIDANGAIQFQCNQSLTIHRPEPGYAEQNPIEIIEATHQLIAQALDQPFQISQAALAIQRSTVLAWDRQTGEALSPALSWLDTRGRDKVESLSQYRNDIKQRSGLMLSPHYGASKLHWLLNNCAAAAEAYSRYSLCLAPLVSYILFHILEGQPFVCDESNAARTQLWNIHQRQWDACLAEQFGVPIELLPEVKPTHTPYGTLLNSNIALNIVCGDQNAAYFGAGELPSNTALVNIGTGAFILSAAGETPISQGYFLDTLAISTQECALYLVEATVNGAGSALQWACNELKIQANHDDLELYLQNTEELPIFVNTIGGLGSPWWRSDIKAFFSPRHFNGKLSPLPCLAAILESIVFLLNYNLEALRSNGITIQQCLLSGGLARFDSLCQRLANLASIQVLRNAGTEATILGLAHLAGHTQNRIINIGARFSPDSNPELHHRYQRFCEILATTLDTAHD